MDEMEKLNVYLNNLTEDEHKQFFELVKKSMGNNPVEDNPKVWKPGYEEEYCTIEWRSEGFTFYEWDNDNYDNFLYSIGNCFKTEDEAKFTIEKLKVIAELKRFALEHNEYEIDWHEDCAKCYIYYSFFDNCIKCNCTFIVKNPNIYFTSEAIAQQAIDAIGEDRLKKYYFEVED